MESGQRRCVSGVLVGGMAMCCACASARAETTSDTSIRAHSELEEIVVVARRREESLLRVPMAITVLSRREIEEAGIERVDDYARLIPNVNFGSALNLGQTFLTIRGLTQVQGGQPPAAVVVDGVLMISTTQFNVEQLDIEQIEVLKGPQGALYGRNAIAGAINILTRAPGDTLEGTVLAGAGRGDDYRIRMAVGGQVVPGKLAMRVAGSYRNRNGQIRNITTGNYTDHYEDTSGRVRLVYTPVDNLEIDLKASYSRTKGGDPTYVLSPSGDPNDITLPVTSDTIGFNHRDMWDASVKVDWHGDIGTLSLVASYVDADESLFSDFDFTALPFLTAFQAYQDEGHSQELRFTSSADRPLRWIAGAYHVKSRRITPTLALADVGFLSDPPEPTGSIDFPIVDSVDRNDFENFAGFAQVEYDLIDSLELALALRYDDDRNKQSSADGVRRVSFREWQPKVSLSYYVSEHATLYGSYGEGFRSGNFNPSGASIGDPVMRAETAGTFELGVKGVLFGNRLSLNAAAFHTSLDDAQFILLDFQTGSNVGLNVERSTLKGFELEGMARLAEGLQAYAAVGVTRAEIDRFEDMPALAGNRPPRVPDYTLNLGMSHRWRATDAHHLLLRADYQRQGRMAWDLENESFRNAVNYLNLRLGLHQAAGRLSVTAWVRNALGERTTSEFQPAHVSSHPSGLGAFFPVAGSSYGVDVSLHF